MSEPPDFALKPGVERGDSAFHFSRGRHRFAFDPFPGRTIALALLGSTADPAAGDALRALAARRPLVESGAAALFAVLPDRESGSGSRLAAEYPFIQFLSDDGDLARAFGTTQAVAVLSPMQRVVAVAPLGEPDRALAALDGAAAPDVDSALRPAPILVLSDVFEPELCRRLVALFESGGGRESGFMQDVDGRSVERFDTGWKRRRDYLLTDPRLVAALGARMGRRVGPEIAKAFHVPVTRIERALVARYDAEAGGHFGPHRDDAGLAVAHRQFAVSINLNLDFDGGEISFPEYCPRGFKAAPGTAIVFSASILHQVSRITRGRRYVFLTFLFDEAAERLRQANLQRLEAARSEPQAAPA